MTDDAIKKERDIFLSSFIVTIIINAILQIFVPDPFVSVSNGAKITSLQLNEPAFWGILITKGIFFYLVFRLSRFLNRPLWLISVYCLLSLFDLLYYIPFIGLLFDVKRARKKIGVTQNPPKILGSLSKSIRAVIQLVLLILIAMGAYWWIGTERYVPEETASPHLPIVLHVVGSSPPQYKLVKFGLFAATLTANPSLSPALPELAGSFSLPLDQGFIPRVSFRVSTLDKGQRVFVKYYTDDYNTEGQYVTNGSSLQPERYFSGHAMSMLLAVFIGMVGVIILSWLQSFLWRLKRSG